jgi:5-hydroxyisourate hydrolase
MSAVTTHVLDTMRGEPAGGVVVRLERAGSAELELGRGTTDADGRIADFGVASLAAGTYRLVFETGPYLGASGGGDDQGSPFFPEVVVTFAADGLRPRYHVPLLLSPYSYSTYRGS